MIILQSIRKYSSFDLYRLSAGGIYTDINTNTKYVTNYVILLVLGGIITRFKYSVIGCSN